jgi:LmbE family N-acetylglucosaminyl deacetylase
VVKTRTHVYLSPHLDDAVLSCGGRIWQQAQAGERVLVVTIFAGVPSLDAPLSPFAQALHALWGLADAIAARREEDAAALALLQAEATYWPYLDCIYRRAPDGSFFCDSEEALFGEVHPAEGALIAKLAGRFRTLAREQGGTLYAPLAVGHHVDHQIVRRAVAGIDDVVYYEDYPYAEKPEALGDVGQIGNLPYIFSEQQWQAELVALSPQALEAKIAAIACYSSQLEALGWADAAEMAAAVRTFAGRAFAGRAFAERIGGDGPAERYWRRVEANILDTEIRRD